MTLRLEPFQRRQIAELFTWFETERDALQWAGAALSWPLQRRDLIALIKQHRSAHPIREVWAVMSGKDMVGHAQITLNRRLRTAGLGRVALAPARRGRALAAPLMRLILTQAFQHDWVHRVDLLVYSHNHAAIAAYQAAGFVLEGTRRETTPIGKDIWDTHIMSLLRPEFDKRTERE